MVASHVLIAGAGPGGGAAARGLRERGYRGPHHARRRGPESALPAPRALEAVPPRRGRPRQRCCSTRTDGSTTTASRRDSVLGSPASTRGPAAVASRTARPSTPTPSSSPQARSRGRCPSTAAELEGVHTLRSIDDSAALRDRLAARRPASRDRRVGLDRHGGRRQRPGARQRRDGAHARPRPVVWRSRTPPRRALQDPSRGARGAASSRTSSSNASSAPADGSPEWGCGAPGSCRPTPSSSGVGAAPGSAARRARWAGAPRRRPGRRADAGRVRTGSGRSATSHRSCIPWRTSGSAASTSRTRSAAGPWPRTRSSADPSGTTTCRRSSAPSTTSRCSSPGSRR